jgi:hypothetical protein
MDLFGAAAAPTTRPCKGTRRSPSGCAARQLQGSRKVQARPGTRSRKRVANHAVGHAARGTPPLSPANSCLESRPAAHSVRPCASGLPSSSPGSPASQEAGCRDHGHAARKAPTHPWPRRKRTGPFCCPCSVHRHPDGERFGTEHL